MNRTAAAALQQDLHLLDEHAERILADLEAHLADRARHGIRAWLLARDIPTYLALMRGETVPAEQLNGETLARYGLRHRRAA